MLVSWGLRRPGFIFYVPTTSVSKRSARFVVEIAALCTVLWAGYATHTHLRPTVTAISASPVATYTLSTVTSAPVHLKPTPAPSPSNSATLAVTAVQRSSKTVATECTPDPSYVPATPLALAPLGPGLHEIIEPTHYYHVYGNTGTEIRQQIARCAPAISEGSDEAFSGETNYSLSWQFSYALSGGQCVITNMTVGLHIIQVYPQWQTTPYAQNGLDAKWQSFINGLKTHEQGHVALGQTYARAIFTDVQSMSAPTCAGLVQAANAAANQKAAELAAANNQYDAATSHGATQGAILP